MRYKEGVRHKEGERVRSGVSLAIEKIQGFLEGGGFLPRENVKIRLRNAQLSRSLRRKAKTKEERVRHI